MKDEKLDTLLKSVYHDIKNILPIQRINEIATQTKFIQRDSGKINAQNFLALTAFYGKDICTESLANLCNCLAENDHICIASQSLDERFNSKAVEFLKIIFTELLEIKLQSTLNFKNTFDRIMITDSTAFQLSDEFEELYKGFSGSASRSGVRIQLTNDLLTGNIMGIDISDVSKGDGKYLKTLESNTVSNDLVIKDLGYYSLKHFRKTQRSDSYYVSRLKLNTAVYFKNPNPERYKKTGKLKIKSKFIRVDLVEIADSLKEGEIKELEVYIGDNKGKLKTRLIIYRIPEELSEKKRQYQKHIETKKKEIASEKVVKLNIVNMFITNVEEEYVPKEFVYLLYTLRWQIELIFKVWKSIYSIDKLKSVKPERFLCHIYGTLISILLSSKLVFAVRNNIENLTAKEISEFKTFKTIHEFLISLILL